MSQRVIAVLGMHRSGTSCLTGTLEEAGVYLGPVFTENPHNKKGNREHPDIMALHEDILAYNEAAWDAPIEGFAWTDEHRRRRDALIEEYKDQAIWGFKDPRALLFLDFWREAIPHLERVGIFRHPVAVAASLKARQGKKFDMPRGLGLWRAYNHCLLAEYERSPLRLIEFVSDPDQLNRLLAETVEDLALPGAGKPLSFFEPGLQHQKPAELDAEADADSLAMYRRLQELST